MRRTLSRWSNMQSISLLVLLVAAVSAVDLVKKDDKIFYHCIIHPTEHGIIVKDRKFPIYLCNTDDGDHLVFASETFHDDKLDAVVDKETFLKLRDFTAVTRPKRQFGGFGGGGSFSNAQANAGGFGGGSPGFGGFGGPGFGGGFSNAQANAGSGGFGTGFGK